MPASLDRIRRTMDVTRSPRDKATILTLRIGAWDNGMISLDGVPINDSSTGYDESEGWLGAVETALITIHEFRRQVISRQREGAS